MQLSPHFRKEEFACSCGECSQPEVPQQLVDILEDVRKYFGKAVTINSGYRCTPYNKLVGGATNSQHLKGTAADIVVGSMPAMIVADYLKIKYPDSLGIGTYNTFTHIDVRGWKARW